MTLAETAIAQCRAAGITPRPYQVDGVSAGIRQAETSPALLAYATGTGKSVMLLLLALHYAVGRPVLLVARGDEICDQMAATLQRGGCWVFTEKAESKPHRWQVMEAAAQRPTVVVGSADTMRGRRLERWQLGDFTAVLWDEGHHSAADTWQAIYQWFEAPQVAVTATPYRKGLDDMWTVAATMTLAEAVEQGWLVKPRFVAIPLESCDLRGLRKTAGDVNEKDLAEVVERAMPEILRQYVAHVDERQPSICFWPSVVASNGASAWLHAAAGIPSAHIDGKTPRGDGEEQRGGILARYARGDLRCINNCGVLTEGFDAPSTLVIGGMRPTLSMTLYLQMIGRGSRPLPGVVDTDDLRDGSADDRRAAIAASAKPYYTVLDYQGTGAAFDFCGPIQLLGGCLGESTRKRAAEKYAAGGDWEDAVRAAMDDEERERRQAEAIAARRGVAERRAEERRIELHAAQVNRAHVVDYLAGDALGAGVAADGAVPERPASLAQRKALYALAKRREKETDSWSKWQTSKLWQRSKGLSMDQARAAIGLMAAELCGVALLIEHLRTSPRPGVSQAMAERIARRIAPQYGLRGKRMQDAITALQACDGDFARSLERQQRRAG